MEEIHASEIEEMAVLTGDVPDAKLLPHVASAKMTQIAVSLFMLIYTYEYLFILVSASLDGLLFQI